MIYWRSIRDLAAELIDSLYVALGGQPVETTNVRVPAEGEKGEG